MSQFSPETAMELYFGVFRTLKTLKFPILFLLYPLGARLFLELLSGGL